MRKRRSRGEGTIFFWEERNLWVARFTLPEGKRKVKYGKTQKEVREWLSTSLNQLRQGVLVENDNVTVAQFFERYLEDFGSHSLRPSTYASYKHNIHNHIIPAIGDIKLTSLRPDHLHALYQKKREEGLAPRTINYLHGIIHRILNKALRWGLINYNVADKTEAPKYKKKEIVTWSGKDVKKFLAFIQEDRWWAIYVLAMTGMREGEILALRWQDVNLSEGYLKVMQALQAVKEFGLIFVEPKSESSRRKIILSRFIIEALKIHKTRQDELRKSPNWKEQGLVFTTNVGTPINPRNLIRHFKSKIQEAGLPEIRFHDLRHTTATLLLEKNTHPLVVSSLLGHSSVNLTLNTYSHITPSLQQEAADKMDDIFK